jgi:hypothetical protein
MEIELSAILLVITEFTVVDIDITMSRYVKDLLNFPFKLSSWVTKIVALSGSVSFNFALPIWVNYHRFFRT